MKHDQHYQKALKDRSFRTAIPNMKVDDQIKRGWQVITAYYVALHMACAYCSETNEQHGVYKQTAAGLRSTLGADTCDDFKTLYDIRKLIQYRKLQLSNNQYKDAIESYDRFVPTLQKKYVAAIRKAKPLKPPTGKT